MLHTYGGGSIPEARTKQKAEQAESQIKQEIFEGRFGKVEAGTMLTDFINDIYMPWAKSNNARGAMTTTTRLS